MVTIRRLSNMPGARACRRRPSKPWCSRSPRGSSSMAAARCSCSTPGSAHGRQSNALAHLGAGNALHLRIHEGPRYRKAAADLAEQRQGSHADELEPSLMLALAPDLVEMSRAEASPALTEDAPGRLTPTDTAS